MRNEKILDKYCGYLFLQKILSAVERAYDEAEIMKSNSKAFDSKKGEETLTLVRNLLVENSVKALVDNGMLNLKYCEMLNAKENCHHFEFYNDEFILTVSKVNAKYDLPRKAIFRENLSCNNQLSLFDESTENDKGKIHLLLTHVCKEGKLDSLIIGIPSVDGRSWIDKKDMMEQQTIVVKNAKEKISPDIFNIRNSEYEGVVNDEKR